MKIAKLWYLEQFDIMKKLKKDAMMRLADSMEMRSVHKDKQIVFPEKTNKNVYFLKKGIIKIGKVTESGHEDYQYLIREGSIFGELALADGENQYMVAVAVEDCMICHVGVDKMKEMMQDNPYLSNSILKIMGLRIKKVERRLEDIMFKDSKTRVIEFILDYITEFGDENGDRYTAKNVLTNKDIAKLTSTSRQTVNAVLNELKKNELLQFNSKEIWVDREQVNKIKQKLIE